MVSFWTYFAQYFSIFIIKFEQVNRLERLSKIENLGGFHI